jgi:hypothetical protein
MPRANLFPFRLILPLVALLVTLPLLLHGPSCGHDFGFHLQNWIEAAGQLRHGHYPRWATTPAWNAGEPRFLFYPPLSWLLGALLTTLLPVSAAPIAYVYLTLTAAAFTMHRLAREFAGPSAALLAAALYTGNVYMLFNAFERSAFAELLASAWIPLLLLAVLRARPTIPGIAIPFALLWLTNAPAAVMGSYTFALLAGVRVLTATLSSRPEPERSGDAAEKTASRTLNTSPFSSIPYPLSPVFIAGTALGLALPAFYLIPAAIERKYVQVAMAVIPNMRYQDNFLFTRTADQAHNDVNTTASYLTLGLFLVMAAALIAAFLASRRDRKPGGSVPASTSRLNGELPGPTNHLLVALTVLATLLIVLLLPISTPVWAHLPELAFLQFPWRLDTIAAPMTALALALFFTCLPWTLNPKPWTLSLAFLLPLAFSFAGYNLYAQGCDVYADPAAVLDFFHTHHGVNGTDEYTPNHADNDVLRTDNPAYWLAPPNAPNTPAPNTTPTPIELNPAANTDDYVPPADQTISTPAPQHLVLHLDHPAILILHLRDYPNWQVTAGCPSCLFFKTFPHIQREDGLIAIPLADAGDYKIDICWHTTWDQTLGLFLSTLALLTLVFLKARSMKRNATTQTSS